LQINLAPLVQANNALLLLLELYVWYFVSVMVTEANNKIHSHQSVPAGLSLECSRYIIRQVQLEGRSP
jgi:hypothetical protein